jgi:CO/xanthine dehydrogenase FAD-binding subunit
MPRVLAYHRPTTIDDAIALLDRRVGNQNLNTRVLGGGSLVTPSLHNDEPAEVVDLQDLGLRGVCWEESSLFLGAMTTLNDLCRHADLHSELRMIALREAPSTLRTIATVGGTVATASWESELLAALLTHSAIVRIRRADGVHDVALADVWTNAAHLTKAIITAVRIEGNGEVASERTVRTGMDTPIVSVVGRRSADGTIRLAATGVSSTPVLLDPTNPTGSITPPSDFRGTSEYRVELVRVLSNRVLARLTK